MNQSTSIWGSLISYSVSVGDVGYNFGQQQRQLGSLLLLFAKLQQVKWELPLAAARAEQDLTLTNFLFWEADRADCAKSPAGQAGLRLKKQVKRKDGAHRSTQQSTLGQNKESDNLGH